MKLTLNFLIILFTGLVIMSCQDDPTSIGSTIIPPDDLVDIDTLDNNNFNYYTSFKAVKDDSVDIGGATNLLLGNYENIKSSILVKYYIYLADSLSEAFDASGNGLNVLDAWVELDRSYLLGDAAAAFDFSVHKVNAEWYPNKFNSDSLNMLKNDIELSVDQRVGSFAIDDSIMSFHINNSMALEWLQNSVADSIADNYGIFITPTAATAKILGFYGLSSLNVDNLSRVKMIVEKPGEFIDTVTSTVSGDVHVNEWSEPATFEKKVVVQAGIPKRGILKVNLDNLPGGIIINNARLTLSYDETLSSLGDPEVSKLYAGLLSDSTTFSINDTFGIIQFDKDGNKYSGDITTFVQQWQNGAENMGLKIYIANDISSASKIVFHGPDAENSDLVPNIVITYTAQR